MRWINPVIIADGEVIRLDSPLCLGLIGTTAAILAGTLAAAGGSAVAGAVGAHAAGSAAKTQSDAALEAARLQKDTADKSLGLQKDMFDTGQKNLAPWLEAGKQGLLTMSDLLSKPGQGLRQGYDKTFTPNATVTDADVKAQFDPGFEYRMNLSNKAMQSLAASKGLLDSGGTAMKLIRNAQELGSQEYQGAFGRAATLNQQQYGRGLDAFNTNANTFYNNQNNEFGRLASLSGLGQQAATTSAEAGANYGRAAAGISQNATSGINDATTGAAAANAAGTVGGANAWTTALSNMLKSLQGYAPMQAVFGGGDVNSIYNRRTIAAGGV